jgi:RNA polymerase sigma factor (TIGR02999 family)
LSHLLGSLDYHFIGASVMESQPPVTQAALDARAKDQLFASLYQELRRLAERQLRRNAGLPISPTTLLHEAYIGMARGEAVFPDQDRFLGYAARVMRGLIIDFIREGRALKRGSAFHITQLTTDLAPVDGTELVRLSEALDQLSLRDSGLAELVDLRYFCGFTLEEIAAQRGIAVRSVSRDWQKARALLFKQLKGAS